MGNKTRGKKSGWRAGKGIYTPNRPPIPGRHQMIVDSRHLAIFCMVDGKFSHYTTDFMYLRLIHGVSATTLLTENLLPPNFTGYVAYGTGYFYAFEGEWNEVTSKIVEHFPHGAKLV